MSGHTPQSSKIPATALPRSQAAQIDWLRLFRSARVGPATFIRLIREHGSAAEALSALPGVAAAAGVRTYSAFSRSQAEDEWEAATRAGAVPLLLGAADYPAHLATISDAPPFLWAIGDITLAQRDAVAMVGARNSSALGCRMARRLARGLGEAGLVVASGLARGIDAAAHEATLATGTIAAQAGGVDVIYPAENTALAEAIAETGLRLSEMPIGHAPRPQDFPRRNRIISGLSLGVVVVEGALRSGSLITARNALDQGREIMAVPGNPMDARAGGCNALIRDGAILVRSAEDIIEALGAAMPGGLPAPPEPAARSATAQAPIRDRAPAAPRTDGILPLLGPVPVSEDALAREAGLTAAQIAATLTDLELSGEIRRHAGGMVSLAGN